MLFKNTAADRRHTRRASYGQKLNLSHAPSQSPKSIVGSTPGGADLTTARSQLRSGSALLSLEFDDLTTTPPKALHNDPSESVTVTPRYPSLGGSGSPRVASSSVQRFSSHLIVSSGTTHVGSLRPEKI